MQARKIIDEYIKFYEEQDHVRIQNSSLVPENDPTTLFTSSGMQPLVPYLLGEKHPAGCRLVNVQNSFRAQDIDEIGDNRHTTFFRMLGNWSLGDYFKSEQIPWIFEFLTKRLNISADKLYVTVFDGFGKIERDNEAAEIWTTLFEKENLDAKARIFYYGVEKNWWSRSGPPDKMPQGEPGGPSTEIFYDFGADLKVHEHSPFKDEKCHPNCDCGRYVEIGNSVFMTYMKQADGSLKPLAKPNVDFGGGLERLVMATENKQDVFKTTLLKPIINTIEKITSSEYGSKAREMRIVTDHLISGVFIASNNIRPANKDQGYVLRRLLRRAFDNFYELKGEDISSIVHEIVQQYKETDEYLVDQFETVKNVILEEEQKYKTTLSEAKKFINKKYRDSGLRQNDKGVREGDELMGVTEITADDAFKMYTSYGLSPTQIKSLGYTFDTQKFAEQMEAHQKLSRAGAGQKFAGGLADHSEQTIKGHTATHLMHQALRDILGDLVHQTGSNITTERIRFDFNYDKKLTEDEVRKVEKIVNEKIGENLPVHFEIMPLQKAKELGAIGLFDDKYQENVKIYFIGGPNPHDSLEKSKGSPTAGSGQLNMQAYSVEFCGGPHVDFTGSLNSFRIIKEEGLGRGQRRIYAVVE